MPPTKEGKTVMGILFKPVRNKYEARGRAEGIAEGVERGRAEGEARGAEIALRAASEWHARMERARLEGQEFSEPPPWESVNGKAE